ncbi:hypothetical protein [Methylobacterium sp. JK268]
MLLESFPSFMPAVTLIAPLYDWRDRFSCDGVVMMQAHISAQLREFWGAIAKHVNAKVQPVLRGEQREREPVIACLRNPEVLTRTENEG